MRVFIIPSYYGRYNYYIYTGISFISFECFEKGFFSVLFCLDEISKVRFF